MAHTVVTGARLTAATDENGIQEIADELIAECKDVIKMLHTVDIQLEPLTNLVPSE